VIDAKNYTGAVEARDVGGDVSKTPYRRLK
jgi:hypothetical protein